MAYLTTTGTGTSTASVGALSAPGSPSASTSGTNVSVTWTAAEINASVAASSYTVERYSGGGADLGAASCSPVSSSSGTPNAFGSFTCTDSPPTGASYEYKITGNYNTAWWSTSGFTNTATVKTVTAATATAPSTGTTNTTIPTSSIASALSGATSGAGGTLTFTVFGPQVSAPTNCTSGGSTVGTATVTGNNAYHPSSGYQPLQAGTYWWYASYGGDTYNNATNSTCGAGGMASTVVSNVTSTSASGPSNGTAGTAIAASTIKSTLSGATTSASGTITFSVYGPSGTPPTTCTGTGWTTLGTATVNGNNNYFPSGGYTPPQAGTYYWYARYGGDTYDTGSNSTCGSGMGTTSVGTASTSTTATGPTNATAGAAIPASSISSVLSGGASPSGTIAFSVYGPAGSAPTTCTGTGWTTVGTGTVSGNGTVNPNTGYTPPSAGTYYWYASYGGDANNSGSHSTCGSGMGSTSVAPATPTITTAGPANDATGAAIAKTSITATITNGASPTGTITFYVYGPSSSQPSTCPGTGSWTTVGTATAAGNGTYNPSAGFTPPTAGTYWWYAGIAADANNNLADSACASGMTSTAVKNTTTLTATGPAAATSGTAIATSSMGAALSGGTSPSGTITFHVYGPAATAPTTCPGTGSWTTVGTATVTTNKTYNPSVSFTPASAGTYWWYTSYAGDANNSASTSTCGSGMNKTYVYSEAQAATALTTTKNTTTAVTSSFTMQPNTSYVLFAFRNSGSSGDSVKSISSTGPFALTLASFSSLATQNYNTSDNAWAYFVTTGAGTAGSETLTVTFNNLLPSPTGTGVSILDVVQLGGNSNATPTVVKTTGSGNPASVTFSPANTDAALTFLTGSGSSTTPSATGLTNISNSSQSAGSAFVYSAIPAVTSPSLSFSSSLSWGIVDVDVTHP